MVTLPPIQELAQVMESARRANASARQVLQATSAIPAHADTTSPAIQSATNVSQSMVETNARAVLTATGLAHCAGSSVNATASTLTDQMCAADTESALMASHCSENVPATRAGRDPSATNVMTTLLGQTVTSASTDSLDQTATKRFAVVASTLILHWRAVRMVSARLSIQTVLREFANATMASLVLFARKKCGSATARIPLTQMCAEDVEHVLHRTIAPVTLATMANSASTSNRAMASHPGILRSVAAPQEEPV